MNTRLTALLATAAALLAAQVGCAPLVGVRYYEGNHAPEIGGYPEMAAAGVQPPHPKFHPVPTQPVFSRKPTVTLTVAERTAPAPADADDLQNLPALALTSHEVEVVDAIDDWASDAESAPAPARTAGVASGSSRRVPGNEPTLADEEPVVAFEPTPAAAPTPAEPIAEPTPSPSWADRFGANDGWRPRVR